MIYGDFYMSKILQVRTRTVPAPCHSISLFCPMRQALCSLLSYDVLANSSTNPVNCYPFVTEEETKVYTKFTHINSEVIIQIQVV